MVIKTLFILFYFSLSLMFMLKKKKSGCAGVLTLGKTA